MALSLQDLFGQAKQGFSSKGLGEASNTGQLQGFSPKGGATTGNAQSTSMRDDYGWAMSDVEYETMESQRTEFDGSLSKYRTAAEGEITTAQKSYDSQNATLLAAAKESQVKLDAARKKLGKAKSIDQVFEEWRTKDMINVHVVDERTGKIANTYRAPKTVVAAYDKKKGDAFANYVNKGKAYNISSRQPKGWGGEKYAYAVAKQLSDRATLKNSFVSNKAIQKQYSKMISDYNKSKSEINTYQTKLNKSVAGQRAILNNLNQQIGTAKHYMETEIGKAEANRKGQIDALRKNYLDGLAAKKEAYGALAKIGQGE